MRKQGSKIKGVQYRKVCKYLGCVRLGNPDLDFQNLDLDFPIEREIQKRISPPRIRPQGGFHFLSFDWEIRKRICKTVLVNSGLLFTNYACVCKTAVPNICSDFPISTLPQ